MRQREYDMCIRHRQQIARTRLDPAVSRIGLTPRAMPISTRVIGDGPVSAGCALIDMTAEHGSAAALDGCQHFQMQAVQPVPVAVDKMSSCQTNQISHLERWPGHLLVCCDALEAQRIERTGCGVQLLGGDVQVDGCLLQIAVAQQQLNRPQVRTGFE